MITIISLVNICHHTFTEYFFLVIRTFNVYSLSCFQICNAVLVTVIAMLDTISPWFAYFITGSLYTFTHFAHPSPHLLWVCAQLLSRVWLFATLWTVVRQALLFMGFLRQEYWSGLPFPSPGDLPNTGIKLVSLAFPSLADRFFTSEPPGKPLPPFSGNHQFVFCMYKLVIFYYLKLFIF